VKQFWKERTTIREFACGSTCAEICHKLARIRTTVRGYFTHALGVTNDNSAKDEISLPNANRVIVTDAEQRRRREMRVVWNPRRYFRSRKRAASILIPFA